MKQTCAGMTEWSNQGQSSLRGNAAKDEQDSPHSPMGLPRGFLGLSSASAGTGSTPKLPSRPLSRLHAGMHGNRIRRVQAHRSPPHSARSEAHGQHFTEACLLERYERS